jgi:hypothetical protein
MAKAFEKFASLLRFRLVPLYGFAAQVGEEIARVPASWIEIAA